MELQEFAKWKPFKSHHEFIGGELTPYPTNSPTSVAIQVLRTWKGGPLRQMAASKVAAAFVPFAKTIEGLDWAGHYVCENCKDAVSGGVRLVDTTKDARLSKIWATAWLCDQCINDPTRGERSAEEKAEIAENRRQKGLRLAASRVTV